MSTAANHRKRSHRSQYRSRAWSGGRKSVIKPTVSKSKFGQFIKLIRQTLSRKATKKPND